MPAALVAVHDRALVEHLATIWADWEAGGYLADYGRDRVVPYVFPTAAMLAGLPLRRPAATHARVGLFCYDTMTLVGPGSWEAIRAAADAARTRGPAGRGRPPGRLRAVPAARPPRRTWRLRRLVLPEQRGDRRPGATAGRRWPGRRRRHRRASRQRHPGDLLRAAGRLLRQRARRPGRWLVPALTWASPTSAGTAPASALTATCRSPPGTGDDAWLAAVGRLCEAVAAHGADAIVLSLGVDAAAADPESPLQVTADGYRLAGELIGALGPVAVIQEGGYDLPSLGEYVLAALTGVQAARRDAALGSARP